MQQTIIIKNRFNGPPESGNGGYVCGLLASMFEGGAEASLRIPPPLDVELQLSRDGDTATLTYPLCPCRWNWVLTLLMHQTRPVRSDHSIAVSCAVRPVTTATACAFTANR